MRQPIIQELYDRFSVVFILYFYTVTGGQLSLPHMTRQYK